MDWVLLVGRLGFAFLFVYSGLTVHLLQRAQGIEYARMNRVPAPELLVPFSGLMAVAGGLSIALGIWADLGALLLVAFMVPVAFGMHAFWRHEDPMQRVMDRVTSRRTSRSRLRRCRSSRSFSSSVTRSG